MQEFGLLGLKLAHSYSPAIHEAFGGYSYVLFEVEDLADFMKNAKFKGINITIPYKQEVMQYCQTLSPTAKEIGSVNTILRLPNGDFYGDNTDAAGFKKLLPTLYSNPTESCIPFTSGQTPLRKKTIIFGNGGSSLSVSYVMKELGEIVVVSRKNNNNEFLHQQKDAAILVNSTPVGMYPNVGESPVSLDYFPNLELVIDLIYNPARTKLMMDADQRGIPNIGGLTMLVGQAAASSEMFTGNKVTNQQAVVQMLRHRMENIILIGMPGSGKTTHGSLLAKILNKSFIDTDAEIEKIAGCTIPEIFEKEGENAFREKETEVIRKFGKESGLVIATGGGCVTREENYRHLHQNGKIIFTERSLDKLSRENRPLSQGNLHDMYEKRLPLYRRFADIAVQCDGEPAHVAEKIIDEMRIL